MITKFIVTMLMQLQKQNNKYKHRKTKMFMSQICSQVVTYVTN